MEAKVNEMPNNAAKTPAMTPPGGIEALSKPAGANKKRTFSTVGMEKKKALSC